MTRFILKTRPNNPHIEVNVSTWTKDSHGLYDYEATQENYRRETFYLTRSCKLFRDNLKNQVVAPSQLKANLQNSNYKPSEHLSLIADITIDRSKTTPEFRFKYTPAKDNQNTLPNSATLKMPFLIVKEYNQNAAITGYPLKPGNLIKLGRVQYMVIQAKNEHETFTLRDTNHFDQTNGVFQILQKQQKLEQKQNLEAELQKKQTKVVEEENCKVCLCNEESQFDPMISPCNCKGSCQLIHVGCLKTWINSKVKKEIKGIASSYNFTKFQCEICKFPFPQIVRFKQKDVQMMTISKPNKPYILLESLNNKNSENKEERCLHLISTQQGTPIKIGRGHECQIRITDISVSRKHAEITLREGQFYISDTKAKFGTLIKLEEDWLITPSRSLKIQCGRTVYEFKIGGEPEAETQ